MDDYLVRATAFAGKIRLFAATTTQVVEEMRNRHDLFPTAAAAVGRTATAAVMIGAMLKGEEKVTVQVKGNGPLGQIVMDANARGEVRGYADHPQTHLPSNASGKLDVAGAVGREGFIYVTKDLGMKEPYRGSIPIISGELAEDFTYYFAKSEQTPSAVSLGVLVNQDYTIRNAGGFIIQVMPEVDDEVIFTLEHKLASVLPVTTLLEQGLSPEDLLKEVIGDFANAETMPLSFRCFCSRERVERTLLSLGRQELSQMVEQDEFAQIVCHFCNEKYEFDREALKSLMDQTGL
jgi:molecular chaperone Hsp33